MRRTAVLSFLLVSLFELGSPGHTGMPPMLPEIDEVAPSSIPASTTSCSVVGVSWCAVGVANTLTCKKNGTSVTLSFNSTTTNWPHSYHLDKTWSVNLTPLGLVAGDVLVWEFTCWATSGPYVNQRVSDYATTNIN